MALGVIVRAVTEHRPGVRAVRGLTTAASVWVTAAVGSAAGAGLFVIAALTTGMYLADLDLVDAVVASDGQSADE